MTSDWYTYNTNARTHCSHTQARKVTKELYSQEGCHPLKMAILPWVQLPLWIVISFALRNMTGSYLSATPPPPHVLQAFHTEGALWFPDLTLPDPYTILPVLLVVTNLLNIEVRYLPPPHPSFLYISPPPFLPLHHFTAARTASCPQKKNCISSKNPEGYVKCLSASHIGYGTSRSTNASCKYHFLDVS